ncbi:MAG: FAD-dependent oxidoreductase [Candidatus Bathyarchaeota archaeon]
MIQVHHVDPEFKHKLKKIFNGETFKFCYQCGTCTAVCPVARLLDFYRPNKIIHLAKLGIRNVTQGNAVWLCAACNLCTENCPQGVKVKDIMHALKDLGIEEGYTQESSKEFIMNVGMLSRFEEILSVLRDTIPIPIVYSWLCLSPCGENSKHSGFDELVTEILQHSLAAYKKEEMAPLPKTHKEKVAIIGSGPAGLTAAWELIRAGFPVTIFESLPIPGGMLRAGIPEYRLPKEVIDIEIERIKGLGVEIRTNTPVNRELFNDLLKNGKYNAVFIATGAHRSGRLHIEGDDLEGVIPVLDLLRQYNFQQRAKVGKKVAVIGGGNTAIDASRTAIRLGAEEVNILYRRSRDEMPANPWEVKEAESDGVKTQFLTSPKRVIGKNGRVTALECVKMMLGEPDESGRRRPVPIKGSDFTIELDTLISAIGDEPDLSFLTRDVQITETKTIAVDPLTLETSLPGVFAGGDAVLGSASVVEAIVTGKVAATSINHYLISQRHT